jgi:hypothetical protein
MRANICTGLPPSPEPDGSDDGKPSADWVCHFILAMKLSCMFDHLLEKYVMFKISAALLWRGRDRVYNAV